MESALVWLEGSALGHTVRASGVWTYAFLNLAHLLGLSALFGAILVLDLRLIGLWRGVPLAAIARPVLPIAATAFCIAVPSGLSMLATNATEYVGNPYLPIKFAAIGAGLINAAVVSRLPAWKTRDAASVSAAAERQLAIVGGISLLSWLTAVGAGRMIAYW